jgi:hypothetical protein
VAALHGPAHAAGAAMSNDNGIIGGLRENLQSLITPHSRYSPESEQHMDTTPLDNAYRTLLDAAATVAEAGAGPLAPAGEWNANQILAHVAIINAATISTVSAITSGTHTTYDNRVSQDAWTLAHIIEVAGRNEGLRERIRTQGEALCALAGPVLSEAELGILVPARLVSKDMILVDQPIPLRDIITGLADVELPGHAAQLRVLLRKGSTPDGSNCRTNQGGARSAGTACG